MPIAQPLQWFRIGNPYCMSPTWVAVLPVWRRYYRDEPPCMWPGWASKWGAMLQNEMRQLNWVGGGVEFYFHKLHKALFPLTTSVYFALGRFQVNCFESVQNRSLCTHLFLHNCKSILKSSRIEFDNKIE